MKRPLIRAAASAAPSATAASDDGLFQKVEGGSSIIGGDTLIEFEQAAQELRRRKAKAVRAALAKRLGSATTRAFGEADPVANNTDKDGSDNPKGRVLNRRVELSFGS